MFAAWFDLHSDDQVVDHPTALRVYARLLRNPRIFDEPQDTKVWALALEMRAHPETVRAALDLLVARGYVIEHPRWPTGVRRLTIPQERQPQQPEGSALQNRHVSGARRRRGA